MPRDVVRKLSSLLLALAVFATLGGCISPFSAHAEDHWDEISDDAREAHRKWDRYFLGLDWDDPYHDWHDESYASGPMHHHSN